jgi:hypothetical protein
MLLRPRSLAGNGFLVVPGKIPLAVGYSTSVSIGDAREVTSCSVVSQEPRDVSDFFGDHGQLQLEDGKLWNCTVLNKEGRLELGSDGPVPASLNHPT